MLARNTTSHAKLLTQAMHRSFSMATPLQKLQFVDHPRYGKIYPVVCLPTENAYPKLSMGTTIFLTCLNTSILYSTFIMPIYTAAASALFANPFFLLPSLGFNYVIWRRSHAYFHGERSEVINIFLKPNGKQFILETRDGESKVINNTDIYEVKNIQTYFDARVNISYGANNFCYIKGDPLILDGWALDNILQKKFIDTRNVDYDFDLSKEWTWDFRELVEIKKRNRIIDRVTKPTIASLTKLRSGFKRQKAIANGSLVTKVKPFQNFKLYQYFEDKYNEDKQEVAR